MNPNSDELIHLVFENLSVRYPGRQETVLHDVSLDVAGGEVVALAGPNGCGKTTLLRSASGLLVPLTGRALVRPGTVPMHLLPPEQRARLAAGVPQMPKLPSGFTVGEAVMVGRISFHGWFGPESTDDRAAVREALAAVGLEADIDCRLETLSGGAQQRMFIARALAQEAPILLMDEPTAHLDLRYQIETLTLLRRLAREKRRAVLIALHDLNLASRFADRVALMDRGRLIACGAPCEVLTADILSPLYAIRLHVFPHPLYGHPLILPDGDDQVADERERRAAG